MRQIRARWAPVFGWLVWSTSVPSAADAPATVDAGNVAARTIWRMEIPVLDQADVRQAPGLKT
ncbi:hypothetical protein ACWGS9_21010 [Bradyrhizobium sp. Arg314]